MHESGTSNKLQKAAQLLARGEASEANQLCDQVLEANPNKLAALMLQSRALQQLGNFEGMLDAARLATSLRPRNVDARLRLAKCLYFCGDVEAAMATVRAIEDSAQGRKGALLRVAKFHTLLGQHTDALRCQLGALQLEPDNPDILQGVAASSANIGNIEQAEKLYDRLIFLAPENHDAWYRRSALRPWTLEDNHIRQLMFVLENLAENDPGRVPVRYALARELENTGHYDEAFECLQSGAAQRRASLDYDLTSDLAAMRQVRDTYDQERLSSTVHGYAEQTPLFIVGLPDSGAGLLEGLLTSVRDIDTLGNANLLATTLDRMTGGQHQQLTGQTPNLDYHELGRQYCTSVRGYGKSAPYLMDRAPLNYLYLGLIKMALPRARVIHLRRFAMDSCYAMYRTLFDKGYPWSYDLDEIGRYYIAYRELMNHWHAAMPGFILDVDYERLTAEPREQVGRILDFLDLEPDADLQESARLSDGDSSINLWKSYRRQLGQLALSLEENGIQSN
jgi:tetratricopeptide (TPR) repeat protein